MTIAPLFKPVGADAALELFAAIEAGLPGSITARKPEDVVVLVRLVIERSRELVTLARYQHEQLSAARARLAEFEAALVTAERKH